MTPFNAEHGGAGRHGSGQGGSGHGGSGHGGSGHGGAGQGGSGQGGSRRQGSRCRGAILLIAVVLSAVAASVGGAAVSPANAAEKTDGLALWYRLDERSGAVAADSSGNGRDGAVKGEARWTPGEGLAFNGSDTHVELPDDLMAGMDSISVDMDVYVDPDLAGPYFIYGFGNTDPRTGWGNGYLFTTGDTFRTSISLGKWDGEQNVSPAPARRLARGTWKHVTYTQTGTTGVLYEDGLEVGRNDKVTLKPGDIGGGATTANHLGRSLYRPDSLFKGRLRDFRVYDRALTAAEVSRLALATATRGVQQDKATLTLGDTGAVTRDLPLPAPGAFGSTVTWISSDPTVVGHDGTVKRPPAGRPEGKATLTATITRGAARDTKTFHIFVLPEYDDSGAVNAAVKALVLRGIGEVRGNLTLPTTGEYGTRVTWRSDRPAVITTTGEVRRPGPGSESVRVNLIATVTLRGASSSRTFEATVLPLPRKEPLAGYMFSYFTGEGRPDGEQLYLALSKGNDPLRWRELGGGRPVLTSTLGDRGLRDPFIIRSPEGDTFYQIATDLKIHGKGGNPWDDAQRFGSKSIMVWESTDLVNWKNQRLVKVSPDTAGNTWAPEAFYDPGLGAYVVFWASKIYAADDPNHTRGTHNRLMYATTRDFYTFSDPKPYIDPGYAVIDTTMIEHGGNIYRFTKDERGGESPTSKMVFQERSSTGVLGAFTMINDGIPRGSGGNKLFNVEGPTVFKSNTENRWYLFLDDFTGGGYKPFETTDLDSGRWTMSTDFELPSSPRHGTVLPVTQAEYDRILHAYGGG